MSRPRSRAFLLSATIDFPDDLEIGVYTPQLLADAMRVLRAAGVRRVNWLAYGSVEPSSDLYSPILTRRRFGPESIAHLGDPTAAAVRAAHANGLELYAVMKPFAGATIISHARPADGRALRRIGGYLDDPYAWLERQPEVRIARRPSGVPAQAPLPSDVASIRLTKADDSPTRVDREHLEIWTSADNTGYRARPDLRFTVRDDVRPAPLDVRDYFGRLVTPAGKLVRSLVLEGAALDEPFVLVTTTFRAPDGEPDFTGTARHMIEALDEAGRSLPTVVATRSATAATNRDFRREGLEFDCGYGLFQYALDADNTVGSAAWDTPQGGCVAFALGRNHVLGGAPCESVPAVQDAWLHWLDSLIRSGVDGVDIRVSAHGSHTDEPFEYGFNDEVLAAAGARVGEEPDLATLGRVRGDAYTQFLRRVRGALRAAGLPLQVHLHTEAFRTAPVHGQLMGFPANLDFQWERWLAEGLVDAATLRTAWYERLGPPIDDLTGLLAEPVVAETVSVAQRHQVPLYLNRYAMDGNVRRTGVRADRYLEDLEIAFRDERIDGFDLYELWALAGPSADGSRVEPIGDLLPRIGELSRRLGVY